MGTISDYLEWRGDLSFDSSPFNEVDNYILTKIGCPDYSDIVPSDNESISLKEAVDLYFSRCGEKSLGVLASQEILKTLKKLPDTIRYKDVRLSGFCRIRESENTKQFSAITLLLPDGKKYISFRGTDDSIIGWKENFMMAVLDSVPAQEEARQYLDWAADHYQGSLIVGGHSKGGNLAFFAASRAREDVQDRIIAVYNNDGPGFNEQFFEDKGYLRVVDRMHHIVPQHSLIGTLLNNPVEFEIVKCSHTGIGSHDGYNWEVLGDHFVDHPELSLLSRSFNYAIEKKLSGMGKDETVEFIDQVFDILISNGADNLSDITDQKITGIFSTLNALRKDSKVSSFFLEVAEDTIKEMGKGVLPSIKKKEDQGL